MNKFITMYKKGVIMDKAIITSVGKAESIIMAMLNDNQFSKEAQEEKLYALIEDLLKSSGNLNGTADDFHNLGISILKIADDYETALEIVEQGLAIHNSNTDLLSDGIRYGFNCGEYEKCKGWYEILQRIPMKLWTWRAFSFSIDYLIDNLNGLSINPDYSVDEQIADIILLSKMYQKYFPMNDDSWYSEYEIYRTTNQYDKGIKLLEEVYETPVV